MAKNNKKYFEGEPPTMCEYPGCESKAMTRYNEEKTYKHYVTSTLLPKMYPDVIHGYICSLHHQYVKAENKQMSRFKWYDSQFKTKKREHRKYVKDHCENRDGRLGFKCTTTMPPPDLIKAVLQEDDPYADGYCRSWLDVDHIDGNSENNDPANLQTLCKVCHSFKTVANRDMRSPGRKFHRKQKEMVNLERWIDDKE